jgi:1-acyl-sn-glycerol-3-phosphate acyltransferase
MLTLRLIHCCETPKQHRPLLMTCNHISTFDLFPFLMLTHVMVLIDAGFFKVIGSTFRKMVGSIPLDQTDKTPLGRQKTHTELSKLVQDVQYPLLFFPEGWDTNGKVGVLMFNKFMFSLGQPVILLVSIN